jgi:hypothetical protein
MRNSNAKQLRKLSLEFATEWLRSMVSPEEADAITPESVKSFEKTQDRYVRNKDGSVILSAYSSRYFYKKLKEAYKQGKQPDLQLPEAYLSAN